MGFERKKTTYLLDFDGIPDMEGLEVRIQATSMGNILMLSELDSISPTRMTAGDLQNLRATFEVVAGCIVEWNLSEDDEPVPSDVDGLMAQDSEFVMTIIKAWVRAMTSVATPLATPSQDGAPSLVASIPMEPLSESQAS